MKFGTRKLESLGVPDGEEIMTLAFFVLTQYRLLTDRWTDRRRDRHVTITKTCGQPSSSFDCQRCRNAAQV